MGVRELRGKCCLPRLILPPRSLPDILLGFDEEESDEVGARGRRGGERMWIDMDDELLFSEDLLQ